MLYTTQMLLVNFPEKNGQAGSELYPEAATSFPTVSKNGLVYTFHLRPGLKFSDGSPVTAAAYQRAWERDLSPKMGSPYGVNDQFQKVVVGGDAFLAGKTQHISGISASGLTLTFHLTKPNPTFVSYLSMQWFGAVKPNMPYTTTGENVYPSAGPYYIASRDPGRTLVLKRNPYYKGSRPANPDQIVFTSNTDQDQSLLQIKAGQTDMDMSGVPPTAAASLGTTAQQGPVQGRPDLVRDLRAAQHPRAPTTTLLCARRSTGASTGLHSSACSASTPARGRTRSWSRASRGTSRTRSTPSPARTLPRRSRSAAAPWRTPRP